MMKTALAHYDNLFGEFGLSPKDAAQWVFVSGWNCACQELMQRIETMPLEKDTKASFAVYLANIMEFDPSEINNRTQ